MKQKSSFSGRTLTSAMILRVLKLAFVTVSVQTKYLPRTKEVGAQSTKTEEETNFGSIKFTEDNQGEKRRKKEDETFRQLRRIKFGGKGKKTLKDGKEAHKKYRWV